MSQQKVIYFYHDYLDNRFQTTSKSSWRVLLFLYFFQFAVEMLLLFFA